MIANAKAKYVRISPRKTRLLLDMLKGKSVEEAIFILDHMNKRPARPVKKVLNSAFSNLNFDRQEKILEKDAFISGIKVDGGPYLMRYRAATMGRATPVRHRTSHIYIQVEASEKKAEEKPKAKTKAKAKKPAPKKKASKTSAKGAKK